MWQPNSGLRTRVGQCLLFIAGLVTPAAMGGDALVAQPAPPAKSQADAQGDPLPPGALARLGTLRWRHADTVISVAFLPDGKAVLTGSQDRTLRLWDRATGKELHRFVVPAGQAMKAMRQPLLLGMPGSNQIVAALSPDGQTLAAVVANNEIQLWDTDTGKEIRRFAGPPNGTGSLQFAPDDKTLAVRSGDRTIHLFDAATGNEIRQIKGKQAQGGARVVVAGQFFGDTPGLAFSPDGKTIASAENEADQQKITNFVRLSEVETGKEIRRIDAPPNGASAVAFSPDGKLLAFAVAAMVHLHDATDGSEIRQINAPAGAATLLFTPDSKTLVGKGRDQVIRLWDAGTGNEAQQFGDTAAAPVPAAAILRFGGGTDTRNLAISADGKTIATGSGNSVRMWDAATGKELPLAGGHGGPVSAVGVSRDGKTVVSRGSDRFIRCWNLADASEISRFREPPNTQTVVFSPDGRIIACAGGGGVIRLYETATGKPMTQLKGHPNGTATLAYSPDGKTLASVGALGDTIRLYDTVKGAELRPIVLQEANSAGTGAAFIIRGNLPGGGALSVAFTPDGKTLIAQIPPNSSAFMLNGGNPAPAAPTTLLRLFDVATGKELRKYALPSQRAVGSIAVSPDGRVLATENADGTVSLWELASGQERGQFGKVDVAAQPNTGGSAVAVPVLVRAGLTTAMGTSITVAFSPDGGLLACKGPANSIRVWDVGTGTSVGEFEGHGGRVAALAFAPDGRRLVSGSNDTTIIVWDAASLSRPSPSVTIDISRKLATALWDELLGDDARKAYQSIRRLAAAPQQAVPLLREQVKPAVPPDSKKLERLIADLDSDSFEERSAATEELTRLADLAVPALQKGAGGRATLEATRRVEALLLRLTTGALTAEQVRLVRAVEVLEMCGTVEARAALDVLAKGAPGR